jgi:hypothetical protein
MTLIDEDVLCACTGAIASNSVTAVLANTAKREFKSLDLLIIFP